MVESIPLSSRKEAMMPKKPVIPETNSYLVLYTVNSQPHWVEYVGARNAVDGYRYLRTIYGDNCRLARVVFDYGKEV